MDVVLYRRSGCYLCDQAADTLAALGMSWREVNVDDDTDLRFDYGDRVPVLEVDGVLLAQYRVSASALRQRWPELGRQMG